MKFLEKRLFFALFLTALILTGFGDALVSGTPALERLTCQVWAYENDYLDDPFAEPTVQVRDPLERFNRAMFTFNDRFYFWFLKPVSVAYGTVIPEGLRICVRNAFNNIFFPVRFVNNALQLKFKGAGVETGRFLINSTLGVGGLFDLAARDFRLHPYDEDFGQTLGRYGFKPVLYIVWPVLGPSTVRDTIGMGGDYFLNPFLYIVPEWWARGALRGGEIMNATSLRIGEYEDFKEAAIDPYLSMRDAFLSYRARQIER